MLPYAFRIVGGLDEPRRLVDAALAFGAYCNCDERAEVGREAYLSAFNFGDMRARADAAGVLTVKGFDGPTWAPWLWFDIDRTDLETALLDARKLAAGACEQLGLDGDDLLLFFSGRKGFHVGVPTAAWLPPPSESFHEVCKSFATTIAEFRGVRIDLAVYDRVRAFRAPNSRHPKTGLHKRRLAFDEMFGLRAAAIAKMAAAPEAFDPPKPPAISAKAVALWRDCERRVAEQRGAKADRQAAVAREGARLNRATLEFIKTGAPAGERARALFSAAANLAEFGCPPELALALLEESALDSGLSPSETRRQIECGLRATSSRVLAGRVEAGPFAAAGRGV